MHRFTDAKGQGWFFELNKANVRKLWTLLQLNLHDPAHIVRLCNQERFLLLPQVLEILQHDQAARLWPDVADQPDELLTRIEDVLGTDEAFERAHKAWTEELADFCRSRGRTALAQYLDATPRLLAKETKANLAQMPDPAKVEAKLDAQLQTLGDSSTSTAENSESTVSSSPTGS